MQYCAKCSGHDVADFIEHDLRMAYNTRARDSTLVRNIYGVHGRPVLPARDDKLVGCTAHYQRIADAHANDPWVYFPKHPPVLVKSHYPEIGDDFTAKWIKKVFTHSSEELDYVTCHSSILTERHPCDTYSPESVR